MALLIGQYIKGWELEQATSSWSPDRFASMCNSLIWAVSGREGSTVPSLTERIYAPDGGIDAEWDVEIQDDGQAVPTPLVSTGWNVFQYKKRDFLARDRARIIGSLKSDLKGAVSKIAEDKGKYPDRYTLFTNIDLLPRQKSALKEAILERYSRADEVHVEIIGAEELAAFLNEKPHLRAAYFTPLAFKTWEEANKAHRSHKPFGSDVDFVGREEELERLRSFVNDPLVRVIVLTGPHDMGKSRLALEGTEHVRPQTVMALDPRSMSLADYRTLASSHQETVCVVEDPEFDSIEKFINEILTIENLKVIITLPSQKEVYLPSYVRDERVQLIPLPPLSEQHAHDLLNDTGQQMDFRVKDWIVRGAGGVPGILLAAASIAENLHDQVGDFMNAVGAQFEDRIKRDLGPQALTAAKMFSLMTHVGISGEFEYELREACRLFGKGMEAHDALLAMNQLEQAGLAKRGGSFVEISIPIFAKYLVSKMLTGRRIEMFTFFAKLESQGRLRFLRRLAELPPRTETDEFWTEFFGKDGPLGNFDSAVEMHHLLGFCSETMPERTLRLFESGLLNSTEEERSSIKGDQRRELVWALERLLVHPQTSRGAVRLLGLLAQAENEDYGNNATGIFKECFQALNRKICLPLNERIELLEEFISPGASRESKIMAISAMGESLARDFMFMAHPGAMPPQMITFSPDEFNSYARGIVDIVMKLSEEGDGKVAVEAAGRLPGLISDLGVYWDTEYALEKMETLVGWATQGDSHIDVSDLSSALEQMHNTFSGLARTEERHREVLERYISKIDGLKEKLDKGDFAVRLKSWAGGWRVDDYERLKTGDYLDRSNQELQKLAQEAVEAPTLLNDGLMEWLLSPFASKSLYFFVHLGEKDESGLFLDKMEEMGREPDKSSFFAFYWQGWAQRDAGSAEARLEELARLNIVTGEAVVEATERLPANQKAIDRVKAQIGAGRVDPGYAGRSLATPQWIKGLPPSQFEELLSVVAGKDLEHAPAAIEMLGTWLYLEKPLKGSLAKFAWRCLECDPPIERVRGRWYFDKLVAKLARGNPERGFELFENLIRRKYDNSRYNPIGYGVNHPFWDTLHEIDRKRLLRLVLESSKVDSFIEWHITNRLKELLDQKADSDVLVSLAKESVDYARVIAKFLNRTKDEESFWRIAFALIRTYPRDEKIQQNITIGFETDALSGTISENYENLRRDVEKRLSDPVTPSEARGWLRELSQRLKKDIQSVVVWEYDIDIAGLQRYIEDKDSPERIWAIGRVLKYASMEDIRKLLNPEDIAVALPHIDLPDERRKALERALHKVWLNE